MAEPSMFWIITLEPDFESLCPESSFLPTTCVNSRVCPLKKIHLPEYPVRVEQMEKFLARKSADGMNRKKQNGCKQTDAISIKTEPIDNRAYRYMER